MIPGKYTPEHNCDPQVPKHWKAGRTLVFCDGLWKESKWMKRYWEVCSKISWEESNSHARGGNVHCPRPQTGVPSRSETHPDTPLCTTHFAQTHLVRSLWLCDDGRPVPKGGAAATVLAVGDDSGVVRAFNPHALHLPGDPLGTFGCGQMQRGRSDRRHACLLTAWLRTHAMGLLPGLLLYQLGAFVCEGILIQCAIFVFTVLFILRNWKHPEKHKI